MMLQLHAITEEYLKTKGIYQNGSVSENELIPEYRCYDDYESRHLEEYTSKLSIAEKRQLFSDLVRISENCSTISEHRLNSYTVRRDISKERIAEEQATLERYRIDAKRYKIHLESLELEENAGNLEIIPEVTEIQQKVAWLFAIGVIDDIGKSFMVTSANGLAGVLRSAIGGSPDAIRKAIERIREPNSEVLKKYDEWINAECLRLKIVRRN